MPWLEVNNFLGNTKPDTYRDDLENLLSSMRNWLQHAFEKTSASKAAFVNSVFATPW